MTAQNPYQPPTDEVGKADVGKQPTNRRAFWVAILAIAGVATWLSFTLPQFAVPTGLLLLPLGMRVLRVRAVRKSSRLV